MTPDDLLCNELHGRVEDTMRQVQSDLADEHDSQTCGCEMCVAADEYEARKAREAEFPARRAENGPSGLGLAGNAVSGDRQTPNSTLWADAATIRAAILDILDYGRGPNGPHQHLWYFYEHQRGIEQSEEQANEDRVGFTDLVLARLRELQQPPHDYPQLQQLCDKHKRRRLPTYSGECVDCAKERN